MIRLIALMILLSTTYSGSWADDTAWGDVGGADLPVAEQIPSEQTTAPSTNELACGEDDQRIENIIPLLREIQAGNTIEPLQLSLETYMGLSPKVSSILGDNFYISVPDCTKHMLFEGEFIESIEIPMSNIWSMVHNALRENNAEKLQFIKKNVKASPESAAQILHYIQQVKLPQAHHSLLKEHLFLVPTLTTRQKEKVFFLLSNFIQLGGRLIPEDVGKKVYMVYSSSIVLGVYLDSGFGVDDLTEYENEWLSGMFVQLGLNPIPVSWDEMKRATWYQKFLELNPR